MNKIVLSIGSNIDKEINIPRSLTLLKSYYPKVYTSSIYETYKVNPDSSVNNDKNFWNLIAIIESGKTYSIIYKEIKEIEKNLGREKNKEDKYYDRSIDIDIILFNQDIIYLNDEIKVPHQELGNCFYVDIPLLELDPSTVHPLKNKTIEEIVDKKYLDKCYKFIKKIN